MTNDVATNDFDATADEAGRTVEVVPTNEPAAVGSVKARDLLIEHVVAPLKGAVEDLADRITPGLGAFLPDKADWALADATTGGKLFVRYVVDLAKPNRIGTTRKLTFHVSFDGRDSKIEACAEFACTSEVVLTPPGAEGAIHGIEDRGSAHTMCQPIEFSARVAAKIVSDR